jgi:hypothetical protein
MSKGWNEKVEVQGKAWKRRDVIARGTALIGAVAVAGKEMRSASAAPNFPRKHPCQHNDQCKSGCCLENADGDTVCKRAKKCKNNGGTP